jgi:hypothetical protein
MSSSTSSPSLEFPTSAHALTRAATMISTASAALVAAERSSPAATSANPPEDPWRERAGSTGNALNAANVASPGSAGAALLIICDNVVVRRIGFAGTELSRGGDSFTGELVTSGLTVGLLGGLNADFVVGVEGADMFGISTVFRTAYEVTRVS